EFRRVLFRSGAEFSTGLHLRTQRLIPQTEGMSHKQETDQDIDDALNASFNGLATGQMDKREVKARLHAVQQKLDDVKRMTRAEQLRFFEYSRNFFDT